MFFWQQHPQAAQLQDAGGVGNDVCTATGFAVGSPVIGAPAIAQNHAIAGAGFSVGSPVIGARAITQNHLIAGAGFAVGSPVIGAASLPGAGNDVCTAAGFSVGSPVIGAASITQNHAIGGVGFAVGSPSIGAAALFGNTTLTAVGFAVGSPVIGSASFPGADLGGTVLTKGKVGGPSGKSLSRKRYREIMAQIAAERLAEAEQRASAVKPTRKQKALQQRPKPTVEELQLAADEAERAELMHTAQMLYREIERARAEQERQRIEALQQEDEALMLLLLAA